jgi:hypothetical protein
MHKALRVGGRLLVTDHRPDSIDCPTPDGGSRPISAPYHCKDAVWARGGIGAVVPSEVEQRELKAAGFRLVESYEWDKFFKGGYGNLFFRM